MNIIGYIAYAGLRLRDFSQTLTINRLSAAISCFAEPNSCHRYTQVPVSTRAMVNTIEVIVETCKFLSTGSASPTHSERGTRLTRKMSWVTVSTMIMKVPKPRAVPKAAGHRHLHYHSDR